MPGSLADLPLELASGGHELVYRFDRAERPEGIADLLRRLGEAGVVFVDLQTQESSLEDIFVNLVRGQP